MGKVLVPVVMLLVVFMAMELSTGFKLLCYLRVAGC